MTFKRIYFVVIETGLSACSQFRRNFISDAFDTEEIISLYDPISNFLPILQLISFQPAKEQYIIISWSYFSFVGRFFTSRFIDFKLEYNQLIKHFSLSFHHLLNHIIIQKILQYIYFIYSVTLQFTFSFNLNFPLTEMSCLRYIQII